MPKTHADPTLNVLFLITEPLVLVVPASWQTPRLKSVASEHRHNSVLKTEIVTRGLLALTSLVELCALPTPDASTTKDATLAPECVNLFVDATMIVRMEKFVKDLRAPWAAEATLGVRRRRNAWLTNA